jgi:hypothetical protein
MKHLFKKGDKPWNDGMKMSKEHRRKLSVAKIGNKCHLGKKHSVEAKEKIRKAHLGIKMPPRTLEHRLRMSISQKGIPKPYQRGEKHGLWKGGITSLNQVIRHCLKYKKWIEDVIYKDDYTCKSCNRRGNYIEAHHLKPFCKILEENKITSIEEALECQELWDIKNGQTLCIKCHEKTKHEKRK